MQYKAEQMLRYGNAMQSNAEPMLQYGNVEAHAECMDPAKYDADDNFCDWWQLKLPWEEKVEVRTGS